jgi:hypothetical protein
MSITGPATRNTISQIAPDGAPGSPAGGRSNPTNLDIRHYGDGLQTVRPQTLGSDISGNSGPANHDVLSNPIAADSVPTLFSANPGPDWSATTFAAGSIIKPLTNNAGGFSFQTAAGGTSSGSYPASWNQTVGGTTTDSGSVVWTNVGLLRAPVGDSEGSADPYHARGRIN